MNRRSRFALADAQAGRWASIRRQGRRRYVVGTGIVVHGILLAVLWSAILHFLGAPRPFLGRLAVALVFFPLGGVIFAGWMWSFHERRYLAWRQRPGGPGSAGEGWSG